MYVNLPLGRLTLIVTRLGDSKGDTLSRRKNDGSFRQVGTRVSKRI